MSSAHRPSHCPTDPVDGSAAVTSCGPAVCHPCRCWVTVVASLHSRGHQWDGAVAGLYTLYSHDDRTLSSHLMAFHNIDLSVLSRSISRSNMNCCLRRFTPSSLHTGQLARSPCDLS